MHSYRTKLFNLEQSDFIAAKIRTVADWQYSHVLRGRSLKGKGCTQTVAPAALLTPIVVFLFQSLVFVDVEKLCYFSEIIVLLPIFDDLMEGRTQ